MTQRRFSGRSWPCGIVWLAVLSFALPLRAASITLEPIRDTTLYEYHPDDPSTSLNSNGSGDFFSAGRSLQRSQIRRGLLQFDFGSLPSGAILVEGTLSLDLQVVDVPRRDASPRPIWLVPSPVEDWGEAHRRRTLVLVVRGVELRRKLGTRPGFTRSMIGRFTMAARSNPGVSDSGNNERSGQRPTRSDVPLRRTDRHRSKRSRSDSFDRRPPRK